MTRINLFRTAPSTLDSVARGKGNSANANLNKTAYENTTFATTASTLLFAALLIACSLAVGCSSDRPNPVSSTNQSATTPPLNPITASNTTAQALPVTQAVSQPAPKKVVRKRPANVTYTDKSTGISFQYPRKYALETGEAANTAVASGAVPMDFVQPGGVALAAVVLPETLYPNTDLASAFFNVSVNKSLTAGECSEFAVPQSIPAPQTTSDVAISRPPVSELAASKLMIGDLELHSAENIAGEGTRQDDAKYFHVFQNGACYEFTLRVATAGNEPEGSRHVDREQIFARLETILATVKIAPLKTTAATAPEVTASAPTTATPPAPESPAQ